MAGTWREMAQGGDRPKARERSCGVECVPRPNPRAIAVSLWMRHGAGCCYRYRRQLLIFGGYTGASPGDGFKPSCVERGADGSDYRGTVSWTAGRKRCQMWTAQSPHAHTRTPVNFPNRGLGAHNYCRNPDGNSAPW